MRWRATPVPNSNIQTWAGDCLATESPLAPAMKAMFDVRCPVAKIGLGWFVSSAGDREIAGHDGGTGGFNAWAGYDPKERIGVVVLSNASTRIGVFDIGMHLLNPTW